MTAVLRSEVLRVAAELLRRARYTSPVPLSRSTPGPLMKRIGILTAGGDTPALNATIHGAVTRANQRRVEVFGIIKGFSGLFNPRVPHVHLNPLFTPIPELDPTRGGTLLGASRDYVDADDTAERRRGRRPPRAARHRRADLRRRRRHAQRHAGPVRPPADRARPQDDRQRPRPELPQRAGRVGRREPLPAEPTRRLPLHPQRPRGRASTSTRWSTTSPPATPRRCSSRPPASQRIRTTAESHRRIAIIEVMGRHSG